jgi:DNA topoisomerase-1
MTKVVIVESPAKCQKIQGFLGSGWVVIATMGHIRALEQDLDAIGLNRDFEAKYEFIKEKAKAIKQLKECASNADEIYLASDDDREGEGISYAVCVLLKLNPNTALRSVFHEITEKAVKYAVEHPRHLDMNRVHAQQARAILDMMIGFTMSPLLWRYVAQSLSAGRCQTPALRLVVEREDQIQSFTSSMSWKLTAQWKHHDFQFLSTMEDELEDEESATNYMESIYSIPEGTILSKEIKPWTESPPQPLITSTLQQQASALYHINPKSTMKIAQRLYEGGHITYMRTDHATLSEEAKHAAKQWVGQSYGPEYVLDEKEEKEDQKKTKSKAKKEKQEEVKAQEAHEAIRPTHMEVTELPEGDDWSALDQKIYKLIWQRTIQSVMTPARGELCKIRTQINGDEDFAWASQWKHTTFEGWKRAGKVFNLDDESDAEEEKNQDSEWDKVATIQIGDTVSWNHIKAEPKETKAQGRYTEATLVRELEKFGIGRPSTFASLLSVIQEKNYVETKNIPAKDIIVKEYTLSPCTFPMKAQKLKKKVGGEKNKLVPTELGRSVLHFMLTHFEDLFAYGFTAQMEQRLDHIAEGTEFWKEVLRDMWNSYKDRYESLTQNKALQGTSSDKVKEFMGGLKAVQSKKGPLLLREGNKKEDTTFFGWPKGVTFEKMTEEIARAFIQEEEMKRKGDLLGEWKNQPIIKKSGKFGTYLQCGEISIPFQDDETVEQMIERFEAKEAGGNNVIKAFKEYVIRTGQYGPYIMKTSLKKAQFVSLPKEVDPTKLALKDVEALYKMGLESKKKWNGKTKKEDASMD